MIGILLQQLTPMDLNAMFRMLLDSGRHPSQPPKRVHDPVLIELVAKLRADGHTWQQVADAVGEQIPSGPGSPRTLSPPSTVASRTRRSDRPSYRG